MPGRKPEKPGNDKKTAALSLRITEEMRARLDAAATKNKRPLSDEIAHRLEQSFGPDKERARVFDEFGSRQNFAACYAIADVMRLLKSRTGKDWSKDAAAHRELVEGVSHLLNGLAPPGDSKPSPDVKPGVGKDLAGYKILSIDLAVAAKNPLGTLDILEINDSVLKTFLGDLI